MDIARIINRLKEIKKDVGFKKGFFPFCKAVEFAFAPYTKIGNAQKHKDILAYLQNSYGRIINKYIDLDCEQNNLNVIPADSPIWTLWLQGEKEMPEIVRKCFSSIKRNADRHPVNLLTKDNIKDYVDDVYGFENINSGKSKISRTHYSDLLRSQLLAKYGGLWIDSTVYVGRFQEPSATGFPVNIERYISPAV